MSDFNNAISGLVFFNAGYQAGAILRFGDENGAEHRLRGAWGETSVTLASQDGGIGLVLERAAERPSDRHPMATGYVQVGNKRTSVAAFLNHLEDGTSVLGLAPRNAPEDRISVPW